MKDLQQFFDSASTQYLKSIHDQIIKGRRNTEEFGALVSELLQIYIEEFVTHYSLKTWSFSVGLKFYKDFHLGLMLTVLERDGFILNKIRLTFVNLSTNNWAALLSSGYKESELKGHPMEDFFRLLLKLALENEVRQG